MSSPLRLISFFSFFKIIGSTKVWQSLIKVIFDADFIVQILVSIMAQDQVYRRRYFPIRLSADISKRVSEITKTCPVVVINCIPL